MSDDFIPLNQSTPTQGRWHQKGHSHQNSYQSNWRPRNNRRGHERHHRWSNNSHQSNSYGMLQQKCNGVAALLSKKTFEVLRSDSNNSYSRENQGIDAYLHPSMLQDPWAHLRQANQ